MDVFKKRYRNVILTVMQGDITMLKTDAVVNAANTSLRGGGGVDGAIHRAGGPIILKECKKYNGCPTGEARITSAGNMPSRYVIHTVGPVYRGGNNNEAVLLKNAYENSLHLAIENKIRTLAFPFISAGVYGYPKEDASEIAVDTVMKFIDQYPKELEEIIFCCFSEGDYKIFKDKIQHKLK